MRLQYSPPRGRSWASRPIIRGFLPIPRSLRMMPPLGQQQHNNNRTPSQLSHLSGCRAFRRQAPFVASRVRECTSMYIHACTVHAPWMEMEEVCHRIRCCCCCCCCCCSRDTHHMGDMETLTPWIDGNLHEE